MSKLTLKEISEAMRDIDICMMSTKTSASTLESRPMSNNRQVDYNGDSYFFADGSASAVQEIEKDAAVNLSFVHRTWLGKSLYISITGNAKLIKDKAEFKKHWNKDVEIWFKDGIDTPGLTLIDVKASRIKYWNGQEEGEVAL